MPLALLTAADEGRIQGDRNRRCRRIRLYHSLIPKSLTDLQSVTAQSLADVASIQRKHLRHDVSGYTICQQGREMRLDPIQLRCRAAMRWSTMASFASATSSTAKLGKPHRDLAEQRCNQMVSVVFHPTTKPQLQQSGRGMA